MKKLLFALAGAASFAALAADPAAGANDISIVGFENYTADQTVIGYGDDGASGSSLWTATGDDASLVKTYGGDNAAAPNIKEPAPFDEAAENAKYLALDTNGSELQRAIPAAGQTIAADGTYIDTLVQFTPSESAPTSTDLTGAKLAIWLGVVENVTNLYVQGGFLEGPVGEGTPTIDTTATQAYKLGNIHVEPGQWHRLTVKAIKLDDDGGGSTISGFQILVDGTLAVSDTAVADAAGIQYYTDYANEEGVFPGAAGLLTAKTLIPSCAGVISDATLTSVGFKGTGALDDFVVTTAAPDFTPAAIDFTLTWPAGLTASYQIGNGEPVSLANETSPFSVPGLAAGDVVKLIVQNADGATKTLTGTAGTDTALDATGQAFTWADYLGEAVNGAYEIDNLAELKLFQKGVANTNELTTLNTTFKLTADVTLDEAWPGIGVQNGKDIVTTAGYDAAAFLGTFDGQNHTISGFQMVGVADNPANNGEGLDYCGFFNSVKGATIQNLKIAYAGSLFAVDTTASSKESGATFVGVAKASTLRNLTTVAGSVSCSKGFGGIVGYLMAGTTVDSCTNNVNMTSLASNKAGGIAMITQNGTGAAVIQNCQNNGTTAGNATQKGGIVGYVGVATTISNCTDTASSAPSFLHHQSGTLTMAGENKASASIASYTKNSTNIDGLMFATVDNDVATFVKNADLALDGTYKAMGPGAAYTFTEAGTITLDQALLVPTVALDASLVDYTLTAVTNGTAVAWTAAAPPASYKVVIEGSDVAITPTAEDLEAFAAQGYTTPEAVNAALDTVITNGVKVWEALFLGLPPTEAGLESFKIDSITVGTDGNVTVALPAGVDPKTGRGVTITLKLMGSDDLSTWTQIETAGGTDNKTFAPVAPASGETKKFYKVVVEYAGSQN